MWKILVAFIVFAAVALTLVFNMGDKIDMQGESAGHDITADHSAPAKTDATPAATPAAPTAPAAPAASEAEKK